MLMITKNYTQPSLHTRDKGMSFVTFEQEISGYVRKKASILLRNLRCCEAVNSV